MRYRYACLPQGVFINTVSKTTITSDKAVFGFNTNTHTNMSDAPRRSAQHCLVVCQKSSPETFWKRRDKNHKLKTETCKKCKMVFSNKGFLPKKENNISLSILNETASYTFIKAKTYVCLSFTYRMSSRLQSSQDFTLIIHKST